MRRDIIGMYRSREGLEHAVSELVEAGIPREEISVLMTDSAHGQHFALRRGTKAAEGAAAGGAAGGVLGALLAGLTAVAALSVPGVGVLVSGPIVAAFAGAGAGAATGGVVGALIGMGVKEHEAKLYSEGVYKGGILVGVRVSDSDTADRVRRVLQRTGALAKG